MSRLRIAGAAHPLRAKRSELLRHLSDRWAAARRPVAVPTIETGLAALLGRVGRAADAGSKPGERARLTPGASPGMPLAFARMLFVLDNYDSFTTTSSSCSASSARSPSCTATM